MRLLTLVNATQDLEGGATTEKTLISATASSHQELARAGTRLDASGLPPNSKGWCIKYSGEPRSFVDGPFAETKELIAGYEIPDQPPGSGQRNGYAQRPRRTARCRAIG